MSHDKTSVQKKRFHAAGFSLLAVFICVVGAQAAGEWKPSKPVQFIVPYAPGGASDILARSIENIVKTEKLCPVPLIVVNQPGGSGTVGMTNVVQQRGNTHMLMVFISLAAPLVAGKDVPTFRDIQRVLDGDGAPEVGRLAGRPVLNFLKKVGICRFRIPTVSQTMQIVLGSGLGLRS